MNHRNLKNEINLHLQNDIHGDLHLPNDMIMRWALLIANYLCFVLVKLLCGRYFVLGLKALFATSIQS